jgi:hypothetical protein
VAADARSSVVAGPSLLALAQERHRRAALLPYRRNPAASEQLARAVAVVRRISDPVPLPGFRNRLPERNSGQVHRAGLRARPAKPASTACWVISVLTSIRVSTGCAPRVAIVSWRRTRSTRTPFSSARRRVGRRFGSAGARATRAKPVLDLASRWE